MEITNINQLDPLYGVYSYADYLLWKFKERVELFKGKLFKMSAPSALHQEISMRLAGELYQFFKGKDCKVFYAPFDVRLLKESQDDKSIYTVVQPDICVICDRQKLTQRGCEGAPNLIIEILSRGTQYNDTKLKFDLYQEQGVPEYWVVDPYYKTVQIYLYREGNYIALSPILETDEVQSVTYPDLRFPANKIFEE